MKTVCNASFIACLRIKKTLLFLLFPCLYWACNETIDSIGMGIQPPGDEIQVYNTTINIDTAYTVKMDSIYTKTVNGLLGNFYDPGYGDIKAGYICQYYPSLGFADSVVNNTIDSVRLKIYYTSYLGDSLAPMEVSVYQVTKKPLENNYYTNIKPDDYCDTKNVWARKAYTAWDLNIADSILSSASYYKNITVPLPVEWGQALYKQYVQNGNTFGSLDDFVQNFKGTYVESSFGSGNLILVDISEIQLFYQECYKNENDQDTIVTNAAALTVTKEVMQLNIFENQSSDLLLKPDNEKMYLKTPAGVYSKIVIPIPEIVKSIGKRKFNSVKLNINAYAQEAHAYSLPVPGVGVWSTSRSKLLLIEQDSVNSFFENQKVADFQTSYTTTYSSSTQTYVFDNIANMIQNAIKNAPEKNLEVLLIPVLVEYYTDSYYTETDYSTAHYLFPSAVTLKKGGDYLQLKIIASDLEINNR
jgi:hypothetical protein